LKDLKYVPQSANNKKLPLLPLCLVFSEFRVELQPDSLHHHWVL